MRAVLWALYQLATGLSLAVAGPFLLARRARHYLPTLPGRLGRYGEPAAPPPKGRLWIHAVSVGEVGVAATLAKALPPDLPLLVTTVTPTGQARARDLFGPGAARQAEVAYLPFDLGFAITRFFARFAPAALVLVEGDYWPLLLRDARRRGLPIAVVNGRVGDRSFRRMRRLKPILGPLFSAVDRFGVQSAADRDRLAALGVPEERVTVTGNLKYETGEPPRKPDLEEALRTLAGGRPLLVAGSTMPGEEEQVLTSWERAGGGARALLLLAPRHPERWNEVEALLRARGVHVLRRSALNTSPPAPLPSPFHPPPGEGGNLGEKLPEATSMQSFSPLPGTGRVGDGREAGGEVLGRPDALLLDSLGELAAIYRLAAAAFIGGTLVAKGGHNPLEAARFGVPIAAGPSMENFRDIAESFDRAGAWHRVTGAEDLGKTWKGWIDDPGTTHEQGARSARLVEENRGALERTIEMLRPLLLQSPISNLQSLGGEAG